MPNAALPKHRATNDQNVRKFHTTSRNIAGTVEDLNANLVEMGAGWFSCLVSRLLLVFGFYLCVALVLSDGVGNARGAYWWGWDTGVQELPKWFEQKETSLAKASDGRQGMDCMYIIVADVIMSISLCNVVRSLKGVMQQEALELQQESGGFEQQYKNLLEQIQTIYRSAKEFHSKVQWTPTDNKMTSRWSKVGTKSTKLHWLTNTCFSSGDWDANWRVQLPHHVQTLEWHIHGCSIQTKMSFTRNASGIVDTCVWSSRKIGYKWLPNGLWNWDLQNHYMITFFEPIGCYLTKPQLLARTQRHAHIWLFYLTFEYS